MRWRGLFGFRLALRRLKHPTILREIGQPAQKILQAHDLLSEEPQAADNSKFTTANPSSGGLAACAFPEKKLPRCKRETLLSRLLFYVSKRFGGDLLSCSQFHPHELAHAALFHRYTVQYVGLGDGAFVVRDDDEFTLFYEPV